MKTIKQFIALFLVMSAVQINAQQEEYEKRHEKIRTYKIAFLTDELRLSSEEAKEFWPVYNAHHEMIDQLKRKEHGEIRKMADEVGGLEALTEKQSKTIIELDLANKKKEYEAHRAFVSKLRKVLSDKKILKLQIAEREFKKQMFEKLRKQRKIKRP